MPYAEEAFPASDSRALMVHVPMLARVVAPSLPQGGVPWDRNTNRRALPLCLSKQSMPSVHIILHQTRHAHWVH